jgi:hypothetical protein
MTLLMTRKKILHYLQLYINHPDSLSFMTVVVGTSGRIYDDFSRLLFLHSPRESSTLANDIPEESGQFRFLLVACLSNIKGSVRLILTKTSIMRISIPLHLSSRSFIPLPRFIRSRHPTTLLSPSIVFSSLCSVTYDSFFLKSFIDFSTHHSLSVTLLTLDFRPFLF